MATQAASYPASTVTWRELVLPKEHGSWSLAFEPIALGLLCAPSGAGACLGVAIAAAFFCRRPLRIGFRDPRAERRDAAWRSLLACALLALLAITAAVLIAGAQWLVWLAPAAVCGGLFLVYDLKNGGREEVAEIAGSAAFAWLPSAFAVLALTSPGRAFALGILMLGRAVPTVIFVRATVRGRKSGTTHYGFAYLTAGMALAAAAALTLLGLAPLASIGCAAFLLARIALIARRPELRAKQIGIFEATVGAAFVAVLAAAW